MSELSLNSKQLHEGIRALANDIADACIHWKLAKDIDAASLKWPLVVQQSNTFWSLTRTAHIEKAVSGMCRAFDQEQSSLHLPSLLKLIAGNRPLFDQENFRERLKDNPFVASLSAEARIPSEAQLQKDMRRCSGKDRIVKKLTVHRNNFVAHQSKRMRLNSLRSPADAELTYRDLEALLARAQTIVNRYSRMFNAETYSSQVIGHDDFETIFRWMQERADLMRAERSV
jgi:hypothetical protein